ncbi:MAG: hypothetical protein HKN25_18335 [Pyrinomonadaceae bacterium]|nr:hypothetical protein [Pyrinomonadaceae bacterium]
MKKLSLILAATALSAVPAFATGSSDDVAATANAPVVCSVTGISTSVDFGTLGAMGEATPIQNTGVDLFCNQPANLSFTSLNGYMPVAGDPSVLPVDETVSLESATNPGFDAGVDYKFKLVGESLGWSTTYMAAGDAVNFALPATNKTGITLEYNTKVSTRPILGGSYSDTMTVAITPVGL